MTFTEMIESWIGETERANEGKAVLVVVTPELHAGLVSEQGRSDPTVRGLDVRVVEADLAGDDGMPVFEERVEIRGPDRISIYLDQGAEGSSHPLGLDPAQPVVFGPVSPERISDARQLETYNSLRWYGLGPDEAMASVGGA